MADNDVLMIPMPRDSRAYAYSQTAPVPVKIVSSVPLHGAAQLVLDAEGGISVELTGAGTEREGAMTWQTT